MTAPPGEHHQPSSTVMRIDQVCCSCTSRLFPGWPPDDQRRKWRRKKRKEQQKKNRPIMPLFGLPFAPTDTSCQRFSCTISNRCRRNRTQCWKSRTIQIPLPNALNTLDVITDDEDEDEDEDETLIPRTSTQTMQSTLLTRLVIVDE